MSYKFIASDLDGTSLRSDIGKLSEKIINSVLEYQKVSGNKFFIATGRNVVVCQHFAKQFGITLPIVTLNGAVVYDLKSEKVIYEKGLEKQLSLEILDYCINNKVDVAVNTADRILLNNGNERIEFYSNELIEQGEPLEKALTIYKDMEAIKKDVENGKQKPIKFTLTILDSDKESYEHIEEFMKDKNASQAWAHINDRMLLDIFNKDANKGEAVKFIAQNVLKIDEKEIIALGDNNNDVEFVQQAKYGVVPANCVPALKPIAYKVLDTTVKEDCMAYFIDELIKNKGEVK